jgi:hypothetical protein
MTAMFGLLVISMTEANGLYLAHKSQSLPSSKCFVDGLKLKAEVIDGHMPEGGVQPKTFKRQLCSIAEVEYLLCFRCFKALRLEKI